MKVLLDARMVGEQIHGISRYTVDLAHGLNDLGVEVSIISDKTEAPRAFRPGVIKNVFHLPVKFANPFESWHLAFINVRWDLHRFDIIHFPSFAVPMPWAPIPWGKVVITLHDTVHLMAEKNFKHLLYYNLVVFGAVHKARAVLTVSDWSRQDIIKKFHIKPERVHSVRNGLEKSWFEESKTSTLPSTTPSFIYLGNTKKHKNVLTLIRAARELWSEGEEFNLQLSLSGQNIPDTWGLSGSEKSKITLIKNIDDSELKSRIKKSHALISPSLIEGFNYPAAEALALGRPVILSQGSAHDELKGDLVRFYGTPEDVAGLKVEMKNALKNPLVTSPKPHNIDTIDEMINNTLAAYGKTRRES